MKLKSPMYFDPTYFIQKKIKIKCEIEKKERMKKKKTMKSHPSIHFISL